MRQLFSGRTTTWTAALALVVLLGLGAVAWKERTRLRRWYTIRGLTRAEDAERQAWAERAAELGRAVLPAVINCLQQDDPRICANGQAALHCFVVRWGPDDPGSAELAGELADVFSNLSAPGQHGVLELETNWLQSEQGKGPAVMASAVRLLRQAGRPENAGLLTGFLDLAAAVLERSNSADTMQACGPVIRASLQDREPDNRLRAVQMALRPGSGLWTQVVPLLGDPSAEVRRVVMSAIGANREAIDDDNLLQWLHDPDPQVRRLCEKALRERGLREEYIKLGRLRTDRDPSVRLQILEYLPDAPGLDWGIWLRSLSHDPAPAVRAAAIRAAAAQTAVDLTDRIDQMAQRDPSPTVRQLAQHYLLCQQSVH